MCKIYFLAELKEVMVSCDTFVVHSVEFPELFRITLCSFLGVSNMSLMSPIPGLSGAVLSFFPHSVYSLPLLF